MKIAIGTSVADMRLKQNISDDAPKSKKKKQRKGNEDGTSSSSSVTASDSKTSGSSLEDVIFKPSILNVIDEDDYAGDSVLIYLDIIELDINPTYKRVHSPYHQSLGN